MIGGDGIIEISDSLTRFAFCIEVLNLSGNDMTDRSGRVFANQLIQNKSIYNIDLRNQKNVTTITADILKVAAI